jgi:large subunit ribosomal protein L24
MNLRKGDEVVVISGDDRGKTGKVHRSIPAEKRVLVEGVNISKRHMKPRGNIKQAGIIERESPISVSKVMLVCAKCHERTRVGFRVMGDGSKARVCKQCNEVID